MQQSIRDEMASMKRDLSTERKVADKKLVKCLKLEKAPVFKKNGNECQYRHNEEVRLKVSDVRRLWWWKSYLRLEVSQPLEVPQTSQSIEE